MIVIRTDANAHIATGHLMRTLAVAKECRRLGTPVCFVFADNESENLLKKLSPDWQDYQIKVLNSQYDDMEAELNAFTHFLNRETPTAALIDSYFVTPAYLSELGKYTKIFYLDDLQVFDYPVDRMNNAAFTDPDSNGWQVTPGGVTVINYTLNPKLAPLRRQFRDIPYLVREKVSNILITTGGTDEKDMTSKIMMAVESVGITVENAMTDPVSQHVVIGVLNCHREKLRAIAAENPRVILYENHAEMAALMQKCDLAISAAGSTLYELCAVGVPTICFTAADNQMLNAKTLSANEMLIYVDDENFALHISRIVADYAQRRKLSAKMRCLVDGYGAVRIAEALAGLRRRA